MKFTRSLGGLVAFLAAVVIAGSMLWSMGGSSPSPAAHPAPTSHPSAGSGSTGSSSSAPAASTPATSDPGAPSGDSSGPRPRGTRPTTPPAPTTTSDPVPVTTPTTDPDPTPSTDPTPSPDPTPTEPASPPANPRTIVSLTFDDGDANQMTVLPMLQSHGMTGTFYIITGYVGAPGYVTQGDIATIAAAGNEIGGHTVTHPDLTTLPDDEVARQVCSSRNTLAGWGYTPTSFAYPFASANDTDESIVESCGYNSARMLGDIASRFGCADCSAAERMTPSDPYYLKALDQVDSTWTLADLQTVVTNAERRGGWLIYTFHNVCDGGCGDPSISPALLDEFLTWLQSREASDELAVRTVGSVIGGSVKPLVAPPAAPAPVDGVNGVHNPGFEDGTECWYQAGYGANTPSYAIGAPANTGVEGGQLTITSYTDGDAKWLQSFDLGGCAPAVEAGRTYSLRAWYQSTAVTQFEVYLRNAVGTWSYWTASPWFAASSTWTQAVWTTPQIPDGVTGISFGLNLFSTGTLSTDDYEMYDTVGAPPPAAAPDPTPLAAAGPPTDTAGDEAAADALGSTAPASSDPVAPDPTSSDPVATDATPTDSGTPATGAGEAAPAEPSAPTPPVPPSAPPATSPEPPVTPADPPAPAEPATDAPAAADAGTATSETAPAVTESAPTP